MTAFRVVQTRQLPPKLPVPQVRTRTKAQVQIDHYDLSRPKGTASYDQYRIMRTDSTLSLAREVAVGMLESEEWATKGGDDDINAFVERFVFPYRSMLLWTGMYAQIDFGWKGYEVVWGVSTTEEFGVRVVPIKIKPLLNDLTWQRRDPRTGDFVGLRNDNVETGREIFLSPLHSLFLNFDDEGVGKYGMPLLERARVPYDCWNDSNDAACRYDDKVAGALTVIKYPQGRSTYNGVENTDNAAIADDILASIQSSGMVSIPQYVIDTLANLNDEAAIKTWEIEILAAPSNAGAQFGDRQRYLDALKIRAMGLPERTLLEGRHGTLAEAEEHGKVNTLISNMRHSKLLEIINESLVVPMLEMNYGLENAHASRIIIMEDDSKRKDRIERLYTQLMADAGVIEEEIDNIDRVAIRNLLEIPSAPDSAPEEEYQQAAEEKQQAAQPDFNGEGEEEEEEEEEEEDPFGTTEESIAFAHEGCGANTKGGGGFQKGNKCAGEGSGSEEIDLEKESSKVEVDLEKASAKVRRALKSHNPATKEKQDASEKLEQVMADKLGGTKSGDNLPMDVVILTSSGEEIGLEIKMVHDGKHDKVHMRKDSRQKKEAWMKENKKRKAFTVIVDNRDKYQDGAHAENYSGNKIYWKEGVGAFRFSTMNTAQTVEELKGALRA